MWVPKFLYARFLTILIAFQNFDPSFPKISLVPKVLSKDPWNVPSLACDLFKLRRRFPRVVAIKTKLVLSMVTKASNALMVTK